MIGARSELRSRIAALPADPPLDTALREATRILRRAVAFDDWVWLRYDPETVLPTAAVDNGAPSWELRLAHCANEHLEDDVNKFRTLARASVPVATLDDGARRRSRRYHELLRPSGIERELRAALVTDGLCWGSLTLFRAKGSDFTGDEARSIAGITGLVAQRLRRAVLHPVPGPGAADPAGPGVVVVGAGGRLEHVTPAAESWLRMLSGPGERAAPGQPAPLPIAGLAVRARAGGTAPPLRIRTTGGEWLTVHAAPDLDPPAGGRTTLILEASRPRELLPLLARAYRLTAREEQVVRLVLVGNSTREISHELRISAHTVQDHLKAVFDKTGVRSRRELAYRFALAYW